MASGRSPSMLRIITRWIAGLGVDVTVLAGDTVGGWVAIHVAVAVGWSVGTTVGLAILQAGRRNKIRIGKMGEYLVFISNH